LKYRGYWALADFAAATIARYISRPQPGILVPVPLTRAKERRREYNQAALIARSLGSRWGLPVDETRLVRVRDGGSQTALTPEARLENIKDAFRARSAKAENFIIIVDDVLTTGATLNAAASALVTAGFSRLGAVTFARTSPFERRI
jgi:ComF family protein